MVNGAYSTVRGALMGEVSAYRAGKLLGVTTNTVVKWVLNDKIKGRSDEYGGRPFYFVDENEIRRVKPAVIKAKKEGKEGVSLL